MNRLQQTKMVSVRKNTAFTPQIFVNRKQGTTVNLKYCNVWLRREQYTPREGKIE